MAEVVKTEVRTYTYDKLMIGDGMVGIYTNPKRHPEDAYLGHGEYANWKSEYYSIEEFAKLIVVGKIIVEEVPNMISRYEMNTMQEWMKVERKVAEMKEKGFDVDKCPHCGSTNIDGDGDAETDGCSADWATWHYWSIWCNDCDDFSHSGKYVAQSGGWY